jgi:carbon monoxide dehydrogenase subunit G
VQLTHDFVVQASVSETWAALSDIEGVAGCFPGATVTSVAGDSFEGSCKVKLGPIVLVYNGNGRFVEKDEAAGTMRIEAKGKDKRGNGTAGADVTATLSEAEGQPGTAIRVVTDLAITGKPAQFGRGVMQDVSDKLLAQFVDCLRDKVGSSVAAAPAPVDTGAEPAPAATSAPAAQTPDAINLGSTVLPVLAKTYGPWLLLALIVFAVVLWIVLG